MKINKKNNKNSHKNRKMRQLFTDLRYNVLEKKVKRKIDEVLKMG